MALALLPKLLEIEGPEFQQATNRWRPTGLLFSQQPRVLLRDMSWRYERLSAASDEWAHLDRAHVYNKLTQRMRLWLRRAHFTWKSDHLAFLQAVAGFYSDYGAVLRLLKIEQARGRFKDDQSVAKQGV